MRRSGAISTRALQAISTRATSVHNLAQNSLCLHKGYKGFEAYKGYKAY
jgi:hypothetical protein